MSAFTPGAHINYILTFSYYRLYMNSCFFYLSEPMSTCSNYMFCPTNPTTNTVYLISSKSKIKSSHMGTWNQFLVILFNKIALILCFDSKKENKGEVCKESRK